MSAVVTAAQSSGASDICRQSTTAEEEEKTINILIYFPPEVKPYEISEHQIGDSRPITAARKDYQFMKNAFLYPPESPPYGDV